MTNIELYRGGEQAHAWFERELPRLSRGFVLKMGFGKACFVMYRGLACLGARSVAQGARAKELDAELRVLVRQLRKVPSLLATIYGGAIDAQVAALAGDTARALERACFGLG